MFTERAFTTWPLVLVGATIFALLFGLVAMMADGLFDGVLRLNRSVLAFGSLAFAGYVLVAAMLRSEGASVDP